MPPRRSGRAPAARATNDAFVEGYRRSPVQRMPDPRPGIVLEGWRRSPVERLPDPLPGIVLDGFRRSPLGRVPDLPPGIVLDVVFLDSYRAPKPEPERGKFQWNHLSIMSAQTMQAVLSACCGRCTVCGVFVAHHGVAPTAKINNWYETFRCPGRSTVCHSPSALGKATACQLPAAWRR